MEVPLSLQARHAGVSKASLRQGLEYLAHISSLFWYVPSAGRFWKFALVGASGVSVTPLTLITLVEYLDAGPTVARIASVGVSILSNFLLHNAFTWRDVRHSSHIHFLLRGALAYPMAIVALGANFAVYYPLIQYLGTEFPLYAIAAFLGIIAGTSANSILSSRFVFRPTTPGGLDPKSPPAKGAEVACKELKKTGSASCGPATSPPWRSRQLGSRDTRNRSRPPTRAP